MASSPHVLRPGMFFGTTRRDLRTPSFVFSEMSADFSRGALPRHTHVEAHFVLVVRGVYVTAAQPNQGLCGAWTLIFNPAGTTHRDRFYEEGGRFLTISVPSNVAAEVERTIQRPVAFRSGGITTTIRRVYSEFQDLNGLSEVVLEGLGLELAARAGLWRRYPDKRAPLWLRRARESIHDCCTESVCISDIAREADVHPVHLARTFRQYFSYSPGEYLRRCRMAQVQQRLIGSDVPLAELSLLVGFADQSQMTNAFKQFTGMTPGGFRRTFRRGARS